MYAIIILLYLVVLASFVVASLFIVYHLRKYSINPTLTQAMRIIFVFVVGLLMLANVILFFSVDWSQLKIYFSL